MLWGSAVAVGIFCASTPLFDVLGYECSALIGVAAAIAFPFLLPKGRQSLGTWGRALTWVAIPVTLVALNGLRVQNCDYPSGWAFTVLGPVSSLVVAAAVWRFAHLFQRRRGLIYGLVFGLFALDFVWPLYADVATTGYHPYLGYFAGSIYDEALSVDAAFVTYRIWTTWFSLTVFAGCEAVERWRTGDLRPSVPFVAAAAMWFVPFVFKGQLGIVDSVERVEQVLSGRVETEHFVIYYQPGSFHAQHIEFIAQDHEFRYEQLKVFSGIEPTAGGKVRSYLYPSPDTKGKLMGAGRTQVAKLWLGEVHVL